MTLISFFYQNFFDYFSRTLTMLIGGIFHYFLLLLLIDKFPYSPDDLGSQSGVVVAIDLLVEHDLFLPLEKTVAPMLEAIENSQTLVFLLDDLEHKGFPLPQKSILTELLKHLPLSFEDESVVGLDLPDLLSYRLGGEMEPFVEEMVSNLGYLIEIL